MFLHELQTRQARKATTMEPTWPRLYITEAACGDCAMWCSCLGWCKQSHGASGGSAMCLDAAVMGTCPTFINQTWKKKGNHVRRDSGEEGWEGMPSGWEKEGERVLEGGGGTEQGSYWCSKHSCRRQLTRCSSTKLSLLPLSAYTVTFHSVLE